jgi:hypothetical protein
MRRATMTIATLLAAAICVRSAGAAVIITEIMFELNGGDDNREWVELYNTGPNPVDISGWRLHDEDAGSQPGSPIPVGTMLAAQQALVLIETESAFLADWGAGINYLVYPGMGTDLNLANTPAAPGDEVLTLEDGMGAVIDVVDYDNESPWPAVVNATGTAIYLLPNKLNPADNDLGGSWARSTAGVHGAVTAASRMEAGSPGTVVIPEPASAVLVVASLAAVIGLGRDRGRRARRSD